MSTVRVVKRAIPKVILIEEEMPVQMDNYSIMRRQFSCNEFISPSVIPVIVSHFFKNSEMVLKYSDTHGVFKVQINDLLVDRVQNWEWNRPPDMARCPDIARYMYNSRKPIDSMIYLSWNNLKEVFEVLDGIHRITALKLIKEANSKPLDLLDSPAEFGSNGDATWIYNQYILVNIRFNASRGDLIEAFETLNKSQAVPELYIRDHAKEKTQIIQDIANEWYSKYKRHFSSSANPIIGNTNRNRFEDLLDKLYEKHRIREASCDKLRRRLEEANVAISMDIPTKASIETRVKCRETGCYLFLYKNDKLEEFV